MNPNDDNQNTDQASPEVSTPASNRRPLKKVILAVLGIILLAGATFVIASSLNKPEETAQPAPSTKKVDESIKKISVVEQGKQILPNGHADPTVVPISDGYRMYVNRQSGGPSGVLIFRSPDGVTWTKEKDIVIPGASTTRAIVLPGGVRIYYPGPQPIRPNSPRADMYSTFSADGLTFTKDPGTVLQPRSNDYYVEGPTVFQLPDKTWRMYFNENSVAAGMQRDGEIWGASSKDGVTWIRDDKVTIEADDVEAAQGKMKAPWKQVLHPFVLKDPKGGYVMFYNSHSEMYAATSSDGINWKKIGQIGIHGADMDGYFQEDGTIRAYYGDFTPQTGGLVYTAVLKIER